MKTSAVATGLTKWVASAPAPMRARLLFLPVALSLAYPLAAQQPLTGVRFRTAAVRGEVLLRDNLTAGFAPRASFPLPPGGGELALEPTTFTPYDRYFGSVRAVIARLEAQRPTMLEACHLMKVGYSFAYATRDPYRPDPPKLTEAQRAGDCKSKALWLYDSLADAGALFAIGKAERNSRTSHAWVYWRGGGRWWILDCTDRMDPIAAESVSEDRYVPYYSFGKNGVYRHEATRLPSAMGLAAAPLFRPPRGRRPGQEEAGAWGELRPGR